MDNRVGVPPVDGRKPTTSTHSLRSTITTNSIYSYIYHRVGNQAMAQDLTSQVFLRVLEAIQRERTWESPFSGWLYRIAHNLVIDHYRRR